MASDLSPLAKTHPARSSLAEVVEQARKVDGETADVAGNNKAAKPQSWADTHPPLPPEQVKVPGGGLRAHEALGGHALEKHVGKTEQELLDRYLSEPKISAWSSFYNEAVAEDAIAAALRVHDAEIKAWLASGSKKPYIAETTMEIPVGIKVSKGTTVAVPVPSVRAVLISNKKSPLGYYILTGHPK